MKKDERREKFFEERNGDKPDPVRVTLTVMPGPTSAARKQAWRKFWARLITEVKREAVDDNTPPESG